MANLHKSCPSKLLYPELSYKLQGCFFTVYNTLGFGHKEVVYERGLEKEFEAQSIPFTKEESLPIYYRDKKIADYRPDFIIDKKIILELKALEFLPLKFVSQLLYYLKGTGYSLGNLVNFGAPKIQIIRRVWSKNYEKKSS